MMITAYSDTLQDTLVAILAPDVAEQQVEQNGQVVRIFDATNQQTIGYNFIDMGDALQLVGHKGQVYLGQAQVDTLNAAIQAAGFADVLAPNPSRLVIGYVESMAPHPDSDHLNITQTRVGNETLQIVSGSPNMQTGVKVVVAQPGTMMPSGAVIWDGALRGVPSAGMIVSGRELHLPGAPDQPGALLLPDDFGEVGDVFDFDKGATLFS